MAWVCHIGDKACNGCDSQTQCPVRSLMAGSPLQPPSEDPSVVHNVAPSGRPMCASHRVQSLWEVRIDPQGR